MANLGAAMGGAFKGLAERAYADLSPEVKIASRQLYYLRVKARTHVRSAEKHHGIAAWKRIKTEYQPEAAGHHAAMLMRVMQPGWDSRGVTNNCKDQLTEWERRMQEYEAESFQAVSNGMKIAVFASHALESIRNVVRLAAGPANGQYPLCPPEHVGVSPVWPDL